MKPKIIRDSLGNKVQVPLNLEEPINEEQLNQIVLYPNYIIKIKEAELYFIKQLERHKNFMVCSKKQQETYVVTGFEINPGIQRIYLLLQKGNLIPFTE